MNGLLKFITCGSVDDGKSTLIGHILYDAKLLYADQEKALELDSRVGSRAGKIDYSLLLDGLMAEREQGITIDVAYRYFTTDRRSFIVADTPGHEEYTRNMAVGASFADLAVILVDATQGVLVQTRRHARICALMGISYFVFAVNKMDLVGYDQAAFQSTQRQIQQLSQELGLHSVQIIPLSATEGDNVTTKSDNLPWYTGEPLLGYLETVDVDTHQEEEGFYLPVQRVCRPDHTFRGFQGQIESGTVSVGDTIQTLPSGEEARVRSLHVGDRPAETACKGQPVTIQLDREVDVSRGCVLLKDTAPQVTNRLTATLLWMDDESLAIDKSFLVKVGTKLIPGKVTSIQYAIDVNSGDHKPVEHLQKNEIAVCDLVLSQSVVLDTFVRHKTLGELILIDRITNATSACGVIEATQDAQQEAPEEVTPATRAGQKGQKPYVVVVENLEAAKALEQTLVQYGRHTMTLEHISQDQALFAIRLLQAAGIITLVPSALLPKDAAIGNGLLLDFVHNRDTALERLLQ
jgi:sulfate adenylyltransferase subunit 1